MVSGNGVVFAGTILGGVYRSTDSGVNWIPVNMGVNKP